MKVNIIGAKGGVGASVLTVMLAYHFGAVATGSSLTSVRDHRRIMGLPDYDIAVTEVNTVFGSGRSVFSDSRFTKGGGYRNIVVVDNSYLAMRRLHTYIGKPDVHGLVVLLRPQRALLLDDVRSVLGAIPLVGVIDETVEMARCIDAGLTRTRLPKLFARQLEQIATALQSIDAGVTP